MVDLRTPIEVPFSGAKPFKVSMRWSGKCDPDPVLTGSETHFEVLIENTDDSRVLEGSMIYTMRLFPPWAGLDVKSRDSVYFSVKPKSTSIVPLNNEWLLAEGKALFLLEGFSIKGLLPEAQINMNDPLCSFTVFERSTFRMDRTRSWATLVLAAVAAVASIIAALRVV